MKYPLDEKNVIDRLNFYVKQINTNEDNDYIIIYNVLGDDFKRSGDTRVTCESISQEKQLAMKQKLITLC